MKDERKTKKQLMDELAALRCSVEDLKESEKKLKRIEASLRQNEAILNDTGAIARIGGWEHDLIAGQARWTKALYDILEMEPGPPPGPNEHLAYYPARDRAMLVEAYQRAIETGESFDLELQGFTAKKRLLWGRVIGRPTFQNGACVRMAGIFQDITERKQVEDRLTSEKNKLQSLVDSIEHGINMMDREFNLIFQSAYSNKFYGCRVGEKCYQVFGFRENVCDGCPADVAFKDGQSHTVERKVVMPSGETVHWEITACPIRDATGHIVSALEIARNITGLKKAEDALRESEERFRSLVETTSDWIWEVDENGVYTYASPRVKELLGYEPQYVIGKKPFDFMPPDEAQRVSDWFGEFIKSPKPFKGLENINVHKDGRLMMIETSGVPIFDMNGTFLRYRGIDRDITDRRQSEEALRQSEAQYKLITDNMTDTVWLMDMNLKTTWISPSVERSRGYTLEDLRALPFEKHVAPGSLEVALKTYAETLTPENLQQKDLTVSRKMELELTKKDGSTFWSDLRVTLLRDPQGHPVGFLGVGRDITKRKEAEEALRQSEKLYRSVIENIQDTFYRTDIAGRLIMMSPSGAVLFGYDSVNEMIGRNIAETFYQHVDDRARLLSTIEQQGYVRDYELMLKRRDGTSLAISTSSHQHFDEQGNLLGIEGILRDISDRKRAEETLRHYEERFSKAFHISPAPTFISTLDDGCYVDVNDSFLRAIGYSREEMIGRTASELRVWADVDTHQRVVQTLHEKGFIRGEWLELRTKTGDLREVLVSAEIITLNENKFILSIFHDMTDQKKLESQLLQAQKMESVGTLAGGIAHDFNNLLMGILGYTSLMLSKMDASHPHYEKLKAVETQVQSGADLTKQLLGFARGGRYEIKPIDMNEVISKTSAMFSRTKKEITVHRKYGEGLWPVEVDLGQIEQVLLNLYVNAWQAMPGGGEIYLETRNVHLDENYTKALSLSPGRYVKISVTDTGVGMDEKTKGRIFEPFFTTKEMGRGTGLGLATVYGIIRGHQGVIHVYSEKGYGTTFNIYLPASAKEAIGKMESPQELLMGQETLLLIDDENVVVEVTREILESLGYQVLIAANGPEAVEIYRSNKDRIDLVILDMIMPGMSGGETFDELKSMNPDVQVILSSGYSLNGQASSILQRGCRAFVQKPFGLKDISLKIREVLDGK